MTISSESAAPVRAGARASAALLLILVLLASAVATTTSAQAAPGDPFDPSVGRVFIGQDVPSQLFSAVQGSGTVTFVAEGPVADRGYNAMGYNTNNDYIYALRRDTGFKTALQRIGQDGVVTGLGAVTGLPTPAGTNYYNQGTFGAGASANLLYVRTAATSNQMYAVDVTTLSATLITLSQPVPNLSDIVFIDGFVWGLHSDDVMYRIDPATGQVSSWNIGLGIMQAFGAQWVYGNGNLGLSANGTGLVYQIAIDGSATASPTFSLVSVASGPSSQNNDGTSVAGPDVDLAIVKTGPVTFVPGESVTYAMTVTNNGPGASSGSVVRDPLPSGFTGALTSTPGCTITGGSVTCVLGPLAVGASTSITVTGTAGAGGSLVNTARVTGNENDPVPENDESTTTAAPPQPFECSADLVYGLDPAGAVLAIDTATGDTTRAGLFTGAANPLEGLALTDDGLSAYAVARTGTKTVYRYDTATGTTTAVGTLTGADGVAHFMGAVNPVDGVYYVGGVSGGEYVFHGFDTTTGTALGLMFRLTPPLGSQPDGDLAFDTEGRAYVVMSTTTENRLVVVDDPPSDGTLATARVLTEPDPAAAVFQGAAFDADGSLFLLDTTGTTRALTESDPHTGGALSTQTITDPAGTGDAVVDDLASCGFPSTLTLRKDIAGRYASGDQFTVSITGNGISQSNTGTTTGSSTGLQTETVATAGSLLATPGNTYTLTETGSAGTDLANYAISWECRDEDDELVADGAGASGAISMPGPSTSGSHVACAFTNTPIPTWELQKEALQGGDPLDDAATVLPGDTITYRVTATNTSAVDLPGVTLTDDLADVLDDATFVAGSAVLTVGGSTPVADPIGDLLTAGPFVLPASGTAVLTYDVVVGADASGATLANVVTGTAGDPDDPIDPSCPAGCTTTQVTPGPFQVLKVGEDAAGDVVPMDGSQWAVFPAAIGGTALVDPLAPAEVGGTPVTGLFRDSSLPAGTYWLEETRALPGFQLLAERVGFTIASDGTLSLIDAPSNVSIVSLDGIPTVRVEDVPALDLPEAGGPGTDGFHTLGLLLAAAGLLVFATLRLHRRAAAPSSAPDPTRRSTQ